VLSRSTMDLEGSPSPPSPAPPHHTARGHQNRFVWHKTRFLVPQESLLAPQGSILIMPQESILAPQESILVAQTPTDSGVTRVSSCATRINPCSGNRDRFSCQKNRCLWHGIRSKVVSDIRVRICVFRFVLILFSFQILFFRSYF
jgi:hypothetical protein